MPPKQPLNFKFSAEELQRLFDPKDRDLLRQLGDSSGLCSGLSVDPNAGLNDPPRDQKQRIETFGTNRLSAQRTLSFLEIAWLAAHDKTLIVLSVAAIVSLALGAYQDFGPQNDPDQPKVHWIEGTTILATVLVVILVGSINDYHKEQQFRKLNATKEARDVVLLRGGQHKVISIYEILVGDIVFLQPGDIPPVDGVLLDQVNLRIDESAATGESDQVRKSVEEDPFILSGSQVMEGTGRFVACCVGEKSFHGKTLMSLRTESTMQTPLEAKLDALAEKIARWGATAAMVMFLLVSLKFVLVTVIWGPGFGRDCKRQVCPSAVLAAFLEIFISAIAVIVVAVPEGLPLAVTLALAYGTSKMLESRNLVRVLSSCETMGSVTSILSDKTGTLTQNEMTVVKGRLGSDVSFKSRDELAKLAAQASESNDLRPTLNAPTDLPSLISLLQESISLNSSAFSRHDPKVSNRKQLVGSKTETALLLFAESLGGPGADWERLRESKWVSTVHVFPFSSSTKCMATLVRISDDEDPLYRIYVKGAPEVVLAACGSIPVLQKDGGLEPMTDSVLRGLTKNVVNSLAGEMLRTLCLAYRDISEGDFDSLVKGELTDVVSRNDGQPSLEHSLETILETPEAFEELVLSKQLTLLAIVGIEDPLRKGVADAIRACQKAGIRVRMVTGDNELTADAIARQSNIYCHDGVAIQGSEFRKLVEEDKVDDVLPKLSVLSRSSPRDKQQLVELLQQRGEVVAVTGDGTNDAPALKLADVGLSMGRSGTEVAKEASDIVLMDDSFADCVKALMWGRAINDSVKKFLQFQLSVNVTATVLAFVSSLADGNQQSVLTATQLLWVNLAMDTLAGLALATEEPTEEILERPPEGREAPLITHRMWRMIAVQSHFQAIVALVLLFGGPWILGLEHLASVGGIIRDLNSVTPPPHFHGSPHKFRNLCWTEKAELRSVIFNCFVFLQLANELNCRRLDDKLNVFAHLDKNKMFVYVMILVVSVQICIMFFGGEVFRITRISGWEWALSIGLGLLALPVGALARFIPVTEPTSPRPSSLGPITPPGESPPQALTVTITPRYGETPPPESPSFPIPPPWSRLKFFRTVRGGRLLSAEASSVASSGSFFKNPGAERRWKAIKEAVTDRAFRPSEDGERQPLLGRRGSGSLHL